MCPSLAQPGEGRDTTQGGIELPKKLNPELHLARASSELSRIKELIRRDICIGSAQGVVYRSQDYAGLEDAGLRQGVIAMVENIHRPDAELNREPFG
jgi:hypothetical protein